MRIIVPTLDGPFKAARRARVTEHKVCHVRDVVVFINANRLAFGQVWFFFCNDHHTIAIIAPWPIVSKQPSSASATVRMDESPVTVPITDIVTAVAYKRRHDGNANFRNSI